MRLKCDEKKVLRLILFLFAFTLSGCASPTARIDGKISEFKTKFPDHIQSYQAAHRKMQFAWSGNPNAQPILFVHGSPGAWSAWAEFLLNEDLQKHFHLIAIDRPGFGGSGEGETESSLKTQAEDILAVLQFNRSGKKAILVGHSYGGAVIAQMAVDQPDRIAGLIFVASSVDPDLERIKWFQYPAAWWPFRVLIPTALRVCNEEITALKGELILLKPRMNSITANVATIQGTADDLVPPANQDFILQQIARDHIRLIERVDGMNHFVPWEHPELILKAIATLGEIHE